MFRKMNRILLSFCLVLTVSVCKVSAQQNSMETSGRIFTNIPDSIQTSVYWYWLSDNISKEGIIKDLHAMKQAGINRAFIGNIAMNPSETPYGNVKIFTPEWWDALHTALKTAGDLNIEIGIFNGPGWSQSGGPWVKPEQAMRYLAFSDTLVKGGTHVHLQLRQPKDTFQDKFVIAYPYIASDSITPSKQYYSANNKIMVEQDSVIYFSSASKTTVRSLMLYPDDHDIFTKAVLYYKNNEGNYVLLKSFEVNRTNSQLNVGFDPYAAVTQSFEQTNSDSFKLVFTNTSKNAAFKRIVLSGVPVVENYKEKTLAKMWQTPHPLWDAYLWPQQAAVNDTSLIIHQNKVIDISDKVQPGRMLDWDAPAGEWIISRVGMTPTNVTNTPASPEGTGLEVDKMSKAHVAAHFDAYIGEILKRIPPEDRKTFKVVVQDSYETGGENWTDSFRQDFIQQYGYDPLPYLPVMEGKVVGSEDIADRFLWDVRRLVADKVAYDYVGGLRDASHKQGLTTWLENYGHWGYPGEFLQYGGQSDEVGGEFWTEGYLGNIENKAASSSAHIYGKTKVSAESFTAGGQTYARYPALLKQRGDRFFCDGINNTLLHVYFLEPNDTMPGVNTGFGTEFNRHNTWFSQMHPFTQYLKRCNMMLQQGKYVADVAYFIGEDAPKMTGVQNPPLPKGYSFDYINAEVIMKRLSVKNGRFVLPDGMSYALLVLPELNNMRPELLKKIQQLVNDGGTILGPRPEHSPSLQNYPFADDSVKMLAQTLWGPATQDGKCNRTYGKGKVIDGYSIQQVLADMQIQPDMQTGANDSVLFIHRHEAGADIYFLSNQSSKKVSVNPVFRVTGKQPELWNPLDGTQRDLSNYTNDNGTTEVPLQLDVAGSAFIVFRKPSITATAKKTNYNEADTVFSMPLTNQWKIQFDTAFRGPAKAVVSNTLFDWGKSADSSVKYYSGKAVYITNFNWKDGDVQHEKILLDLGNVTATAAIKVNNKDVGGVWVAPYSIDITSALKKGNNTLEITVANTWVNRLIGDQRLPVEKRKTWLSYNPYKPDSELQPSGLLGPVKIIGIKY
ncbi:glycosyl hydrolase [Parafilimonas sp.]|uniref:glycosyl hydrolase n=1 Tax=Parafilimonas sp. TaxID=1969739 RepID=UPI003F81C6C3